jgi:hypothetical protein
VVTTNLRQEPLYFPTTQEFFHGIKAFDKNEDRGFVYRVALEMMNQFQTDTGRLCEAAGILLLTWNQAFYRYGSFNMRSFQRTVNQNRESLRTFGCRRIASLDEPDKSRVSALFGKFMNALQIDVVRFGKSNTRRGTLQDLKKTLDHLGIAFQGNTFSAAAKSIQDSTTIREMFRFDSHNPESIHLIVSRLNHRTQNYLDELSLIRRSPVAVAKALHLFAPNFFPLWDEKIALAYGEFDSSDYAGSYFRFSMRVGRLAKKLETRPRVRALERESRRSVLKLIDEYNYAKYTKGWL